MKTYLDEDWTRCGWCQDISLLEELTEEWGICDKCEKKRIEQKNSKLTKQQKDFDKRWGGDI